MRLPFPEVWDAVIDEFRLWSLCGSMHSGGFMPSCWSMRPRWKPWTSLPMRSSWCRWEARMMAGGRVLYRHVSSSDQVLKGSQLHTGRASACRVVVWDIETKQAICGGPASGRSSSPSLTVRFFNTSSCLFVTAGRWGKAVFSIFCSMPSSRLRVSSVFVCSSALRVWELDPLNRKLQSSECQSGILKRVVRCVEVWRSRGSVPTLCGRCSSAPADGFIPPQISEDDQFVFCGTTSGDVMKFNLKSRLLSDYGPKRFSAKHSRVGPPTGLSWQPSSALWPFHLFT